jgi:hypothetical protein
MPAIPSTFETILLAEQRLNLPTLTYYKLLNEENDWTFILRIHVLFEGVLQRVVKHVLQFPEGHAVAAPGVTGVHKHANIENWENATYRAKLDLALKIQVLEPDYYVYLLELGRLRNRIVHNLNYFNFDLSEYTSRLSPEQWKRFNKAFGAGWKDIPAAPFFKNLATITGKQPKPRLVSNIEKMERNKLSVRDVMVTGSPRASVWFAGIWTLGLLSLKLHYRIIDGRVVQDNGMEPNLQDLLLDPEVLAFKKKAFQKVPNLKREQEDLILCWLPAFREQLRELSGQRDKDI